MHSTIKYFIVLITVSIFCFTGCQTSVWAKTKKDSKLLRVEGKGCFVYGDNDTPASAKEKALILAKRNAIESHKTFISSSTKIDSFELKEDLVNTLAAGYLYKIKTLDISETGRKICVQVEAYINSDEIDDLLAKDGKLSAESKDFKLYGEWEVFKEKPSISSFTMGKNHSVKWKYSVPKILDDTYAGLGLHINPISMDGRKVLISLESKNGFPIHIRFYSFTPGYSKEDDDDTFVPVEASIRLVLGFQEILIEPSILQIPQWWLDEQGNPEVEFFPKNVRIIEFEAQVDEDIGPVSDTIKIESVLLK